MSTEEIWNKFSERLEQFIASRVKNSDEAKDLLQEVFVKIHLNEHQLKSTDKLTSWLYTITRNAIIDYYRKRKISIDANKDLLDLPDEQEEEITIILNKCLQPLVESLPTKYKTALIKTAFENQSQKDFAKEQSLSYTAAKSRAQRAKKMVKELMINCCHPISDVYGNIISKDEKCQNECGCD